VIFHDRITAVDAGDNLVRIVCPRCGNDIALSWYGDLLEHAGAEFDDLDTTVPCCPGTIALDSLHYDQPCGLARFEIAIANPVRPAPELSPTELATNAAVLGHPVRQILAHI